MAARIPTGWQGSGDLRVRTTGQVPGAGGVGAFRQVCQYSHMAPEDPVIFPGTPLTSPLMVYPGNSGAGALIDTRTGTPLAPTEFNRIRTAATCESHLLGDGRVIDGTGDI